MYRLNLVKNTNFEWGNNQIFLTQWKIVFWVTDHFCIKWTLKKNAIFCPKNAFFGQTCQFDPLCRPVPACSQGHNFRGVYFYLIPEGFIGGRWGRPRPPFSFGANRNDLVELVLRDSQLRTWFTIIVVSSSNCFSAKSKLSKKNINGLMHTVCMSSNL